MKKIEIDGKIYFYTLKDGAVWIEDSQSKSMITTRLYKSIESTKKQVEVSANTIVSPVTGIIREVRIKKNDNVESGDVLIVVESMKAFFDLTALSSGHIKSIKFSIEEQVKKDEIILYIEP